METIYLVRRRGCAEMTTCERCGKKTMTLKVQYTMKGSELIRRGYEKPPRWMEERDGTYFRLRQSDGVLDRSC
jgi:hypothetical protein